MSTPPDARELLQSFWNNAWTEGLWAASWNKSIEGLTPEQAAWSPAPGRHSIWQIVLHMVFWRENELRRFATGTPPSAEEVAKLNFPAIPSTTQAAWDAARARLLETQNRLAAIYADPSRDLERAKYLIPHDAYHFGQINYLRALQSLPPIE
jgi:uncharacterized damage-inducible protein DinB